MLVAMHVRDHSSYYITDMTRLSKDRLNTILNYKEKYGLNTHREYEKGKVNKGDIQ